VTNAEFEVQIVMEVQRRVEAEESPLSVQVDGHVTPQAILVR
jgi:hypothetical protein